MLTFRTATMDDSDLLFRWRNDDLTRRMSKNTDAVQIEGHVAWLQRRLSTDRPHLYVAFDPEPVGTFRIDGDEISYTVAPDKRGQGIAKAMLTEARKCFGPLRAEIYRRNEASIAAAKSSGMIVHIID